MDFNETGPNRVLCGGFLGWRDVCLQSGIPTLECVPEVDVQDLRADLQQQVRAPLGSTHLLFLGLVPPVSTVLSPSAIL